MKCHGGWKREMQFSRKAERQREFLALDCFRSNRRFIEKPSNQRRWQPLANKDVIHGLCADFGDFVFGKRGCAIY
jgi:hypothetical protein